MQRRSVRATTLPHSSGQLTTALCLLLVIIPVGCNVAPTDQPSRSPTMHFWRYWLAKYNGAPERWAGLELSQNDLKCAEKCGEILCAMQICFYDDSK